MSGWIISSRPTTWSSTASRRSKPGPSSTSWPDRPTRRPASSWNRIDESHAGLGPDATRLVGYFVMIVYGQRGFRAEVLPADPAVLDALQGRGESAFAGNRPGGDAREGVLSR